MQTTDRPIARVVLADDHHLVRCGFKALLAQIPGVEVIAEARDGDELVTLVDGLMPDIVMTDISMPPGLDGLSAIARIHARHPAVRLVVMSSHETLDVVRRAVASGACGYLMKDASVAELERAVHAVMANRGYFSGGVAQLLLRPAEPPVEELLTPRQVEVLTLIASGKASKEIGFALGLSPRTVDVQRSSIMKRLSVDSIAGLTRYAARKGLVSV